MLLRESHRQFRRFSMDSGEHFQLRSRCFGYITVPRVLIKFVSELGAFLRVRGLNLFQYLDDWLLVNRHRE